MNPYVTRMLGFLGDEDPILVLETTPVQLEALLLNLGDDVDRPYAPGRWSARQVLAHLADNELAAGFRLAAGCSGRRGGATVRSGRLGDAVHAYRTGSRA